MDGYENGIFISNSNKTLQIKNCTILHKNEISSDNVMSAIGIYFQNCTNIQVTDCTLTQNSYGMLLLNSTNILIEESTFNNNKMTGIYSNHSSKNLFLNNNIKQNNNTGFILEFSDSNTISVHNISENYFYGIHLKNSNENRIQDSYIQDNGKRNVFTQNSVGTQYSGNTRMEQWIEGFLVELGAVVFVTAYVIYKHSKDEKRYKIKKEFKKFIENDN
nr:right-handed parallel beta-helix repeat-containing protein [Candidatus Prometheoarchaeum syntrophicum]